MASPVRPRGLSAALLSVLLLLALGAGGTWAYHHLGAVLHLDQTLPVTLRGTLPVRAALSQDVQVGLDSEISARVRLGTLNIPIHESISVPLDFTVKAPIDTHMAVDDVVVVSMRVPVDMVLTERELDLSQLEVPIDTDVFVDDSFLIDTKIPIETEVTTTLGIKVPVKMLVPIKTRIPIKQKVHVRDRMKLGIQRLRVPLHLTVPVEARLPIKQTLHVQGEVSVPIKQRLTVPISQTMHPAIVDELPVVAKLQGQLPAHLRGDLDATITLDQAVETRIGALHIAAKDVTFERR
jgi:hypothetical protein